MSNVQPIQTQRDESREILTLKLEILQLKIDLVFSSIDQSLDRLERALDQSFNKFEKHLLSH